MERGGVKNDIKTEAMRLFAERGVEAVSIRDIARACGMSHAGLYFHFESREVLIRELFEEGYEEYAVRMALSISGDFPFRKKLSALVRLICNLHDEDRLRFRFILMTQHVNLPGLSLGEKNPVEIVVRLVADAMAAGEIPERNAELIAAAIIGAVLQPATFLLYGRIGGDLSPVAEEIVSLCMRIAV